VKLEGEFLFNGPQDEVWKLVRDPEVLATALPGTKSLEQVGDNEYQGEMNVRIGPVAGVFSGTIIVSDEVPPESLTLTVDGKGKPGFVKGVGHCTLTPQEDNSTILNYDGDIQVGGRLASVGQRLLDTTSKSMIRQGLEALNAALMARVAADEEGLELDYVPPSEGEFAAAVAKDLVGEVFTPSRLIWIGIAVKRISFLVLGKVV
jgi:carbon monoxide dehydrogenase subunit G